MLSHVSPALRRQASASQRWGAWVGDAAQLERLALKLDELLKPRLEAEIVAAMRDAEETGARWKEDETELAKRRNEREMEVREEWAITATATRPEFSTEYAGSVSAVLAEIPFSAADSFKMSMRRKFTLHPEIEIRLSRRDGCTLSVDADDPEWVRAAFTTLRDEVRLAVPRWHLLRTDRVAYPLFSFLGAGMLALAAAAFHPAWAIAGAAWGATILGLPSFIVIKKVLPGFELLPQNGRSKGDQRLRWLGGLLTGVVSSIIATIIYSR